MYLYLEALSNHYF